jgi:hypothetical protein
MDSESADPRDETRVIAVTPLPPSPAVILLRTNRLPVFGVGGTAIAVTIEECSDRQGAPSLIEPPPEVGQKGHSHDREVRRDDASA